MIFMMVFQALSLPEHFGRNLDALANVLRPDIKGQFGVWESSSKLKALKKDYSKIASLLKRVAKQRDDFKVIFL